ncbi:MAG: ABC transporter permease [Armatimonadetes bacterium]|nr:ABC transporter permease [Armatimonadota bacterium]
MRQHRLGPGSLAVVSLVVMCAALAPYLVGSDPLRQRPDMLLEPPSRDAPLGTDELGRDVLSRVVYGARYSVAIGLVSVALGVGVGAAAGTVGGYFGGRADMVLTWTVDVLMAFPGVLLAILIVSVVGSGLANVMMAVGLFSVPVFARIARSSAIQLRAQEFVEAARALGAGHLRVLWHHVLRNSLAPIVVYSTLRVATAILVGASLSFLGLGVAPPTPEWGTMISTGREYFREAPHVVIFPGLAIFLTVLSVNFLGDILRDALDPRLRE